MKRRFVALLAIALLAALMGTAAAWPQDGSVSMFDILTRSLVLFVSFAVFFIVLPKLMSQPFQIFAAMLLGLVCGWLLPKFGMEELVTAYLGIFGTAFILLLKMIIIPVVFVSIVCGVASIGDIGKLGSLGIKTLGYYLFTTVIAVFIGITVVNLIKPGEGLDQTAVQTAAQETQEQSVGDRIQKEILPAYIKNPFMADQQVLTIIFFAIMVGAALAANGDKSEPALKFFRAMDRAMITLVFWIMVLAPIGVFALMANATATMGLTYILSLAKYCLTVLTGLGLHFCVLVFGVLVFAGKFSPKRFLTGMSPALQLVFSTASSSATLPVTIDCASRRVGVNRGVCSFMLPIGATINMDGTALYLSVASIFIAQVYGIPLSIQQQLMVFLTAIIVSVGAAGIPGASVGMMAIVLESAGIPIEGIAIIMGVDRFLDMCRSSVNIVGDSVGTVVVARSEGLPISQPDLSR